MASPQPPEAALIARKREEPPRMSIRQAAARAGISETRWRQLERGERIFRGRAYRETAPADTLAAMARAVGITPAELTAAGREDAAAELAAAGERRPRAVSRNDLRARIARLRELAEELEEDLEGTPDEETGPIKRRA